MGGIFRRIVAVSGEFRIAMVGAMEARKGALGFRSMTLVPALNESHCLRQLNIDPACPIMTQGGLPI
jgi:hypothetical protein